LSRDSYGSESFAAQAAPTNFAAPKVGDLGEQRGIKPSEIKCACNLNFYKPTNPVSFTL